jgi:hypothetical protein
MGTQPSCVRNSQDAPTWRTSWDDGRAWMTAAPNGPMASSGIPRPSFGTTSAMTATSSAIEASARAPGPGCPRWVLSLASVSASRFVPAKSKAPPATRDSDQIPRVIGDRPAPDSWFAENAEMSGVASTR